VKLTKEQRIELLFLLVEKLETGSDKFASAEAQSTSERCARLRRLVRQVEFNAQADENGEAVFEMTHASA
jgi:hypothetical protein